MRLTQLSAVLAGATLALASLAAHADDRDHDRGGDHGGNRGGPQGQQHQQPQGRPDHGPQQDHRAPQARRPAPQRYPADYQWRNRDEWRRAHAHALNGRYLDDWHRGYYYKPGQYVWYNGRAWQPARPLSQAELTLVPGQAPGLWLDITASIPLN
ncbi:hypothetical protein [Amantichitinum ursilacus]|uniref:Uncharacterized protein n=1 Tax=Amantichitinum ursilacus TaxID=857265 RepID=A0A0N0GQ41_9NEIS|nr:hypothetical protein [Amantichitinum ursilacus]KPC54272.1 hypothetical protein WG78_06470 [Amantichitinum ursilacus]